MPKASTRFRTRKINFKSAISIYVGSFDNPFDEDFDPPSPGGLSGLGGNNSSAARPNGKSGKGETVRVETGVDKEEEGEHHLQAVISASAAALHRSSAHGPSGGPPGKQTIAHIPTPDATGMVANYDDYYEHNVYIDPHAYIRYSDTVEETSGIAYTMDEDDEDFLIEHNLRAAKLAKINGLHSPIASGAVSPSQPASPTLETLPKPVNGIAPHPDHLPLAETPVIAVKGHYPPLHPVSGIRSARPARKAKDALVASPAPVLSEDDFELIMDLFERITDRKTPTLHLDISRIPSLEDLEPAFSTYLPSHCLRSAKTIARIIYPHWKERRTRAGGKNIVPQLDYDETNETPYVCFRRREVKVARKTRRTDTQTIERLIRLKSDLASAQELLIKVLDRERCKREAILAEAKIFENRVQLREFKRKAGENAGDEAILVARREKKRKREEQGQSGSTKIVIPNRAGLVPLTPGLLPDPLPPYKDRTAVAVQRVDKDMQRKREQELGWEDLTDTAFLPLPQALSARLWRASEKHSLPLQDGRKPTQLVTFDHANVPFAQCIGSRYRKRAGRGGRIHLDRMLPLQPSRVSTLGQEIDEDLVAKLSERWRYDCDVYQDLPSVRQPFIYDDYDIACTTARLSLVTASDWESLLPNSLHIEEAIRWTAREPDRLPPLHIVGKLPGQRIAGLPLLNGAMANPVTANMANQMYAAANRALNVAQAQAQQIRRASQAAPNSPIQPQPVPSGNPPQPPQIRRLMWENGNGS